MRHLRQDYERFQDPALAEPSLLAPGCSPVGADEPVFLLRARDGAAVSAVLAWCEAAAGLGADAGLVAAVRAWAAHMLKWRSENLPPGATWRGKVPDCPADQLQL